MAKPWANSFKKDEMATQILMLNTRALAIGKKDIRAVPVFSEKEK